MIKNTARKKRHWTAKRPETERERKQTLPQRSAVRDGQHGAKADKRVATEQS